MLLGGQEGALHAFEEDLVVQRGLCAAAEGDADVHERGVLGGPLVGLTGAHGPAQDGAGVGDAQLLGHELVLGADVVVDGAVWEGLDV